MCVQCMIGAMGATAGASGARAWLATRRWAWLSPRVLKRITLALVIAVLTASSILLGGSGSSDRSSSTDQAGKPSATATGATVSRPG